MWNVQEYIVADRQWPRNLRIAHAKSRLQAAKTHQEKTFWQAVLDANQD